MPRGSQAKQDVYLAREQYNDAVSDIFTKLQKDQRVFYVGSTDGSSAFSGRRVSNQKATISQALSECTSARGDTIIVSPFHSETVTSTITVSKTDIQIKGLKCGNKYPSILVNGATDLFSITGPGVKLSGVQLGITTTDAATALVNVAAEKCELSDLKMIGSATGVNVVDCITLASGADDILIKSVDIWNTTVAVNSFLSIEAAIARMKMLNCFFFGDVATAGIIDSATATQIYWDNVVVGVVGTTKPAATLDSNPTGLIRNSDFAGTHGTLATNAALGTGVRLFNVRVLEETGGTAQGAQIPAVDSD